MDFPFALASFMTAKIPFLLIVFNTEAVTFKVTHLSSSGIKNLFLIRLTSKRRFVLLMALETLLPNIALFPLISQTLDIILDFSVLLKQDANLTFFMEYQNSFPQILKTFFGSNQEILFLVLLI